MLLNLLGIFLFIKRVSSQLFFCCYPPHPIQPSISHLQLPHEGIAGARSSYLEQDFFRWAEKHDGSNVLIFLSPEINSKSSFYLIICFHWRFIFWNCIQLSNVFVSDSSIFRFIICVG